MRKLSIILVFLATIAALPGYAYADQISTTAAGEKQAGGLLEKVAKFEKGKTTFSEVVSLLGEPTAAQIQNGVKQVSYVSKTETGRAAASTPIIGLFAAAPTSKSEMAMMGFNKDGVLVSLNTMQF